MKINLKAQPPKTWLITIPTRFSLVTGIPHSWNADLEVFSYYIFIVLFCGVVLVWGFFSVCAFTCLFCFVLFLFVWGRECVCLCLFLVVLVVLFS